MTQQKTVSGWRVVAVDPAGNRRETNWVYCDDLENQHAVLMANRSRLPDCDVQVEFQDEEWPEYLDAA